MKYARLTKRISKDEEAFLFHSGLHEGIERLAELEDKIESGELISTKETGDTEIEFFCKHNDAVRKETVQSIFKFLIEETKDVNASGYDGLGVQDLTEMAKVYGVELVGISDKLGGEVDD